MSENDEGTQDQTAVSPDEPAAPLQVNVQDVSTGRKCLTIEVPAERITDKLNDSFQKLGQDADIPGFRRGRVPQRLVEKRFGSTVRNDVCVQLVSECYDQAVKEQHLEIVGDPEFKNADDIKLPDDGPLTIEVEVDVAPQVELPDMDQIPVTRPELAVTAENVAQQIELLQKRFGHVVNVTDRPVKANDIANAHVRVLAGADADDQAEVLAEHERVEVTVPDDGTPGHVAGILVNDLHQHLVGKKVLDVVRLSTTGPAGHEDERIKDQPITITIRINDIFHVEPVDIPTLMERFAAHSSEALDQHVRQMLEHQHERQQREAMRQQIIDHLTDNVPLELPETLTGREADRLLRRHAYEMTSRGMDEKQVEQRLAEDRAVGLTNARKHLATFFILNAAAKKLAIEVTTPEINSVIASFAAEQGRRPERMRQQIQRRGDMSYLKQLIREQKTLDQLLAKAKITDAAPTPS